MVNQSLKNKKIIISAGASGIGWATAKICLARGAYVYLCEIGRESCRESLENYKGAVEIQEHERECST